MPLFIKSGILTSAIKIKVETKTTLSFKTKKLKAKDTIFFVSSKSFTTQETLMILKEAINWSGDMNKFVAITTNKEETKKYNIKHVIEFDKEIGGRYSIWSEISILIKLLNKKNFDIFQNNYSNLLSKP